MDRWPTVAAQEGKSAVAQEQLRTAPRTRSTVSLPGPSVEQSETGERSTYGGGGARRDARARRRGARAGARRAGVRRGRHGGRAASRRRRASSPRRPLAQAPIKASSRAAGQGPSRHPAEPCVNASMSSSVPGTGGAIGGLPPAAVPEGVMSKPAPADPDAARRHTGVVFFHLGTKASRPALSA